MTEGECPHAWHTPVCGTGRGFAGKPSAADPQDWPFLSKWTTLSSGLLTLAVPDTALLSVPFVPGDALGLMLAYLALWSKGPSQSRACNMVLLSAVCISEHSTQTPTHGALCAETLTYLGSREAVLPFHRF